MRQCRRRTDSTKLQLIQSLGGHRLLKRYPVTASEFHLIEKETERGWEQAEDSSTLLPWLKRYERNTGTLSELLRERLKKISLNALEKETGLSRNTILRARRGETVHPISLQRLSLAAVGGVVSRTPFRLN
jgi:transcriptional antiterminator